MTIKEFVKDFKDKKIQNSKSNEHAVSDYLKEHLEIKTYLPFNMKREIVELVVAQNTKWVDGVKRNDAISQYISFVVAMIKAHTKLKFSDNPIEDYDILAESKLLPLIIAEFQESYNECDIMLKMALAMELENNNINVLVGRFLNSILNKLDSVGSVLKEKFVDVDINDFLGADFNDEDLANLKGFLNKYNK